MTLRRATVWAMVVLGASACTDAGPAEPDAAMAPGPGAHLSLGAYHYLSDALDVMEFNSVRRHEIDWPTFRERTMRDAAGSTSAADTHPVIMHALERLGDGHSFFRPPVESAPPVERAPSVESAPLVEGASPAATLLGDVGYLRVPAFAGGGVHGDSVASEYHRLIEGVDTLGAGCRWVVDLRGNTGGNMWPMIAGVGPILGEDTVGFFVDADSLARSWVYDDGASGIEVPDLAVADVPYQLGSPRPWVAVLTDSLTASSGEAVAVAFRGRESVRSFGEPTWGVSTANAPFLLDDGAVIFLTVSTLADRRGTVYGGRLAPDEAVAGGEKTGDPRTDAVLEAALAWLSEQACG